MDDSSFLGELISRQLASQKCDSQILLETVSAATYSSIGFIATLNHRNERMMVLNALHGVEWPDNVPARFNNMPKHAFDNIFAAALNEPQVSGPQKEPFPGHPSVHNIMILPLKFDNISFGVIAVGNSPNGYSQTEIDMVQRIIGMVVHELDIYTICKNTFQMHSVIEDALALRNQFFAFMSHDIRTPLHGTISSVEILSKILQQISSDVHRDLVKEAKLCISMLKSSNSNLLLVLNNILDYSSLKIESRNENMRLVDFDEMILDAVSVVHPLLYMKNCCVSIERLVVRKRIAPYAIFSDRHKFTQIMINLLSNAAKFSTEKSIITVSVTTSLALDHLLINIHNHGDAIPPSALPTLFEPFKPAVENRKRRYEGSGLGLAICKNFCTAMKWDIQVTSDAHTGTTFSICIPIAADVLLDVKEFRKRFSKVLVLRRNMESWVVDNLKQNLKHLGIKVKVFRRKSGMYKQLDREASDVCVFSVKKIIHRNAKNVLQDEWVQLGFVAGIIHPVKILTFVSSTPTMRQSASLTESLSSFTKQSISVAAIEDNHISRKIYDFTFKHLEFANYEIFPDGDTFLDKFPHRHFDLVICDLHLPDKDATEIIPQMDAIVASCARSRPIIMLCTADVTEESAKVASSLNLTLLHKPFTIKVFMDAIKNAHFNL